jgi:hypothetical protein
MKNIVITIISIFSLVVFFGCKKTQKQPSEDQNKKADNLKSSDLYFTFYLNAEFLEDDEVTLFYLINDMKDVSREKSVMLNVSGQIGEQQLEFRIKEKELPTRIFLKFKNQNQIIHFKNARLTYSGREFQFPGELFYQYFVPNDFIDYNRETFTATARPKNGVFKPQFSSRKVLEEKIDLILY